MNNNRKLVANAINAPISVGFELFKFGQDINGAIQAFNEVIKTATTTSPMWSIPML